MSVDKEQMGTNNQPKKSSNQKTEVNQSNTTTTTTTTATVAETVVSTQPETTTSSTGREAIVRRIHPKGNEAKKLIQTQRPSGIHFQAQKGGTGLYGTIFLTPLDAAGNELTTFSHKNSTSILWVLICTGTFMDTLNRNYDRLFGESDDSKMYVIEYQQKVCVSCGKDNQLYVDGKLISIDTIPSIDCTNNNLTSTPIHESPNNNISGGRKPIIPETTSHKMKRKESNSFNNNHDCFLLIVIGHSFAFLLSYSPQSLIPLFAATLNLRMSSVPAANEDTYA